MNPLEGRIWDLERKLVRLDWMLLRTEVAATYVQQKLREVEHEYLRQSEEEEPEPTTHFECDPCDLPLTGSMSWTSSNFPGDATVRAMTLGVGNYLFESGGSSGSPYWTTGCFDNGAGGFTRMVLFCSGYEVRTYPTALDCANRTGSTAGLILVHTINGSWTVLSCDPFSLRHTLVGGAYNQFDHTPPP